MNQLRVAEKAALQVIQEAVKVLAVWTDSKLTEKLPRLIAAGGNDNVIKKAVEQAQRLLSWNSKDKPKALRLLFDSIDLSKKAQNNHQKHYSHPDSIANSHPRIPYPVTEEPKAENFNNLKDEIKQVLDELDDDRDLDNLSLLTLILEKYGSFISFGDADVALIDIARSTAAVAAALVSNPEADQLTLIAGDLSGIQNFIYTISSDGALKSLRARSFYLELITEEVVQQLLAALELPRTNVIYAGGGNLYILAGNTTKLNDAVNCVSKKINKWLMNSFQGKLFLAIDWLSINTKFLNQKEFAESWILINKKLAIQKRKKFKIEIQLGNFLTKKPSYEPCRVCHRDDLSKLKPLKNADSSPACWLCIKMFDLGDKLFKINAIVRSCKSGFNKTIEKAYRFYFSGTYYFLFENLDDAFAIENAENIFVINNLELDKYRQKNTIPLLLGNYGKLTNKPDESGYIRSGEMAEKAEKSGCIPRVGYLQMDVDNLGRIFADGLEEKKRNLLRISGLSRQISYFFKIYLNSLAEQRDVNFIEPIQKQVKVLEKAQFLTENERKNLLFIYAGGDDLFISGSWNEIVEFAFDIYQCFRAYTGHHPDISLSGGISIDEPKFPLYQAAKNCQTSEKNAKNNKRDSLSLFDEVFKWEEWIRINDIFTVVDRETATYLARESKPKIFGVLDFVKTLTEKLDIRSDYSRNFIRGLLDTAEMQEQMLKKYQEKYQYNNDIRYYLHLPKLAYALSRLPEKVRNQPDFIPVRQSLMNPQNASYFRAIATWIELLSRSR